MDNNQKAYYTSVFTAPTPHREEIIRWEHIKQYLDTVKFSKQPPNILDAGCGRGWLANLLSSYGNVTGVDPVDDVIKLCIQSFPQCNFVCSEVVPHCNTLPNYYDVVVSSEVIEHVLKDMQLTMLDSIHNSISPGGSLILTTPVGDVADIWFSLHGQQPLEEWLTESACGEILKAAGFRIVDHHLMYSYTHDGSDVGQPEDNELNLYHVIPLYQVWHSVKELA